MSAFEALPASIGPMERAPRFFARPNFACIWAVASLPAFAAAAAAANIAASPSAAWAFRASTAGMSASMKVLSPTFAFVAKPSSSRPAAKRSASSGAESSVLPASTASAMPSKSVP